MIPHPELSKLRPSPKTGGHLKEDTNNVRFVPVFESGRGGSIYL